MLTSSKVLKAVDSKLNAGPQAGRDAYNLGYAAGVLHSILLDTGVSDTTLETIYTAYPELKGVARG